MSAVKITYVYCDGAKEGLPCPTEGHPWSADVGPGETAEYQRGRYSWKHIGGKDYCEDCAAARAKAAKL